MSRREEEEEEVNAVHMVAILRAQEEEEEEEKILVTKVSTKKEVNVKSLESNRLRRLIIEADKLKNATVVHLLSTIVGDKNLIAMIVSTMDARTLNVRVFDARSM